MPFLGQPVMIVNLAKRLYSMSMKTLIVGDVGHCFADIIEQVKNGEKIQILFGTSREPVAMIIPIENKNTLRKIGVLEGKALFNINGDSKLSEEEFFRV